MNAPLSFPPHYSVIPAPTFTERRERDLRFEWLMIVFLWVMAIDAILVMKTLQPNDRWYPVWTTAMCALITLLAAIRLA